FDAALYAEFLRKIALARGVRRTEGRITEVTRRADGGVDRLTLSDARVVAGDLFIDCSGFASLLLGRALGEPFVDYGRWLPVDRAWACPSEPVGKDLTPYTRATALDAGWAWRIPLQNRVGNVHVIASRYIDEERAREQLLAQLDGPALAEPRLLKFATGHRERFWVHNVIALGLSAGFLEPLESTSIFLIQSGIGRMMALLSAPAAPGEREIAGFNRGMLHLFARVRDFIILHYCLSARRDSEMWRHMTSMELPDTLAYKLEAWRHVGVLHQYDEEGFDGTSWLAIHAGMQHWPALTDPTLGDMPRELALYEVRRRRDSIAAAVATMPRHADYLRSVLAR
ncbi:MAG: tryptophan halogenase family protein, partial [Massilia sp.]